MQIVHQSPETLELEHRPIKWMLGLSAIAAMLLIGLIRALADGAFGGAAVAAAMLGGIVWIALTHVFLRVRLVADRSSGTLEITTTSPLGEQAIQHSLAEVVRAEVENRYSTTNSSSEPGLVLVLGSTDRPDRLRLELFRPDPADLLQAERCINGWLTPGAESTRTSHPTPGNPAP